MHVMIVILTFFYSHRLGSVILCSVFCIHVTNNRNAFIVFNINKGSHTCSQPEEFFPGFLIGHSVALGDGWKFVQYCPLVFAESAAESIDTVTDT